MINRLQGLKPQICYKHNQPITLLQQGQPVCQICINQQPGNMTIDQFYQQLEKNLLKQNQENEQQHQLLQSLWDSLISYQTNFNKHLERILQLIKEQIGLIKISEQNIESMIQKSNNYQKLIGELEEEIIKRSKSNQSVKKLIENLFLNFKQKLSNIDQIVGLLKQNPIQNIQNMTNIATISGKVQIQHVQAEHQDISNKFKYQIMEKNSVESGVGYSFNFNRDNNILVVGSYKVIIIYEFNNGKISQELQRLQGHTEGAICLYFMKKSNGFVSGSNDKQIIIWELNQNNQLVAKQTLNDHQKRINCLLMNKNEDLLISGSNDYTIKFWRVQNESWNCVQSIKTQRSVYDLKLNEMENKLISCSYGSSLLVYEIQKSDQQQNLVQTIDTSENGYRLCFTIGDQFVFQPATIDYLEIYDYDNHKKQFYKLKQVQIQSCKRCLQGFPCQFIRQLNILTVKHGEYLNIFRVRQDGNYQLIQTIEYQSNILFGRITDNGEYLITWDSGSMEIQFRKLTQLEQQYYQVFDVLIIIIKSLNIFLRLIIILYFISLMQFIFFYNLQIRVISTIIFSTQLKSLNLLKQAFVPNFIIQNLVKQEWIEEY